MSTSIYTTQEKLNSILDIEQEYTIPDAELFDLSDYPNNGIGLGYHSGSQVGPHLNGELNGMYGVKHTDESKRLMSINSIGNSAGAKNGMYGVKHTKEMIKFLSEHAKTRTGAKNSMYGKTHTDETREKQRQCKLGRKLTIIDGKRRYV